ncbi:serine aminopeptidase domain-containing protein [Paraburkholderia sp. J67]|uniref:alpha/beta hydrolase family protein n=1 Tax=Paraburkholderia sp. J67 TaxID=2805435 RepID=UPI002ABE160B|nr:alpha/beta hydrolase [Paraburkholderia sp. J67]
MNLQATPEPLTLRAADGFALGGFVWRHRTPALDRTPRPLAIVNAATAVRCRYYFRFAAWLHRHGWDVIVYDYRGIGESPPQRLAALDATWLDWGERDFEAVLRHANVAFAGQPIDVVAHSIGGFVTGLAPSGALIRRVFTVGAQYAHWRDYAARSRIAMLIKWHAVMPALAGLCGYFPAARLGWMEDTPRGVALSWSRSRARFEDTYARAPIARTEKQRAALVERLASFAAPILAVSLTDDPFGTVAAIERLLAYFTHAPRAHLRIAPAQIGVPEIGHFAFFHARFENSLWPGALHWLRTGTLAPQAPGKVVSAHTKAK